jgi:hypothetical protein
VDGELNYMLRLLYSRFGKSCPLKAKIDTQSPSDNINCSSGLPVSTICAMNTEGKTIAATLLRTHDASEVWINDEAIRLARAGISWCWKRRRQSKLVEEDDGLR